MGMGRHQVLNHGYRIQDLVLCTGFRISVKVQPQRKPRLWKYGAADKKPPFLGDFLYVSVVYRCGV